MSRFNKVIGSGLLATAFSTQGIGVPNIFVYAAGVSNSSCTDPFEFNRERERLIEALKVGEQSDGFVYFSTCSIVDPDSENSPYIRHKKEMEELTSSHRKFLIVRLPQVAGRTPNPHTLLNYLYTRVSRSERFIVWAHATRNIIDIDDAVTIVRELLRDGNSRQTMVNVANSRSYNIRDIVAMMEKVVGKRAIIEMIAKGVPYTIDTSGIAPIVRDLKLAFDNCYLERVMRKYYGQTNSV